MRSALLAGQQRDARLEASLSRARLDYLEAQLQPHFLFNSLGAVSELAFDAPLTANRVLHRSFHGNLSHGTRPKERRGDAR